MNARRRELADKLWTVLQPHLKEGELRDSSVEVYKLLPTAGAAMHQAEALLVALDVDSVHFAFEGVLSAARWGAIKPPAGDPELYALLYVATVEACRRILDALPAESIRRRGVNKKSQGG